MDKAIEKNIQDYQQQVDALLAKTNWQQVINRENHSVINAFKGSVSTRLQEIGQNEDTFYQNAKQLFKDVGNYMRMLDNIVKTQATINSDETRKKILTIRSEDECTKLNGNLKFMLTASKSHTAELLRTADFSDSSNVRHVQQFSGCLDKINHYAKNPTNTVATMALAEEAKTLNETAPSSKGWKAFKCVLLLAASIALGVLASPFVTPVGGAMIGIKIFADGLKRMAEQSSEIQDTTAQLQKAMKTAGTINISTPAERGMMTQKEAQKEADVQQVHSSTPKLSR